MDINRAKEILSALAEGVDPTTGEFYLRIVFVIRARLSEHCTLC